MNAALLALIIFGFLTDLLLLLVLNARDTRAPKVKGFLLTDVLFIALLLTYFLEATLAVVVLKASSSWSSFIRESLGVLILFLALGLLQKFQLLFGKVVQTGFRGYRTIPARLHGMIADAEFISPSLSPIAGALGLLAVIVTSVLSHLGSGPLELLLRLASTVVLLGTCSYIWNGILNSTGQGRR